MSVTHNWSRAGKAASSYPHDDDAVFYLYALYAQKYGWTWMAALAAQQPQFARGSFSPSTEINNKTAVVGLGTAGSATTTTGIGMGLPDGHPFMAWGQPLASLFLHAVELQGDRPAGRKSSVDLRGNLFGLSDHSVLSGQVVRSHATVEREHRHVPGTRAQTCPRPTHVIGGVPRRRTPCRRRCAWWSS
jgi:hypothetical protein